MVKNFNSILLVFFYRIPAYTILSFLFKNLKEDCIKALEIDLELMP